MLTSVNPATDETIGMVPVADASDVEEAVDAARDAQPDWANRSLADRLAVLEAFQDRLLDHAGEIAGTVTRETGKPLGEAVAADVQPVADSVDFVAGQARDVLEVDVDLDNPMVRGRTSRIVREPVGVVGVIAPWNYPFGIPGSQVVYALAAGNAVVLKPAEQTPLAADLLADLLADAGIPDDVLQVVHGPGPTTGAAVADADVDHLQFTGSTDVGWDLHARLAERGVSTCLELGGSDPAIVLDDADLELAADGIIWARFANAGQTCSAVKRVLAVPDVADRLTAAIGRKVRKLRVGDPLEEDVDVGPLIGAGAVETIDDQVRRSVEAGARVSTGGKPVDRDGFFYEPTLLVDVPPDAPAMVEETFGPVLPIHVVDDEDEAIERANATDYGLTASVWTGDLDRGRRLARRLDAGTVTVNEHAYTYALSATPWIGRKASGHGATHGRMGLEDVTEPKHLHVAEGRRGLWWFPYADDQAELMQDALDVIYGDDLVEQLRKMPGLLLRERGKDGL